MTVGEAFCPWYPLSEASAHAPEAGGVFQIKLAGALIDYPRGKSAMIHYGHGDNVRAAVAAFSPGHVTGDLRCRHLASDNAESLCRELLEQFERRFGASPTLPGSGR